MKFLLFFSVFVLSTACAQVPANDEVVYTIRPGDIRLVEFPTPKNSQFLVCSYKENNKEVLRDIRYQVNETKSIAVITASYFSSMSPIHCSVQLDEKTTYKMTFKMKKKNYKSERIHVDQKTIKLSTEDQARADKEQQVLNKIYANSASNFLFDTSFIAPLMSKITSVYGTRRVYNDDKKSQHLGTDFRAAIGDKIPAVNAGKVVFAGELFYTGYTVIIDHGLEIFTVYGHLSKTIAKEGDMVKRGDLIALSGNTGRSSGPHLHWGVKIQGQYIDGFSLIEESKKYYRE